MGIAKEDDYHIYPCVGVLHEHSQSCDLVEVVVMAAVAVAAAVVAMCVAVVVVLVGWC